MEKLLPVTEVPLTPKHRNTKHLFVLLIEVKFFPSEKSGTYLKWEEYIQNFI